jgi:hypothetical protein
VRHFRFFLVIGLLALLPLEAGATAMSLVGVMNSESDHFPGGTSQGHAAFGGGLLNEYRFYPHFSFEFDVLFLPTKWSSYNSTAGANESASFNTLEFPFLVRAHIGRVFSLGTGAYFASRISDYSYTVSGASNNKSITNVMKKNDFGVVFSAAFYIPLRPLTHIVIDGRYTSGLSNDSPTAAGSLHFVAAQVLAGLRLGF